MSEKVCGNYFGRYSYAKWDISAVVALSVVIHMPHLVNDTKQSINESNFVIDATYFYLKGNAMLKYNES